MGDNRFAAYAYYYGFVYQGGACLRLAGRIDRMR